MSKQPKPRCRYNCFKHCPEKPFYVMKQGQREIDDEGCQFFVVDTYTIDAGLATEHKEVAGMCVDLWSHYYGHARMQAAVGNQQATEQLRNGLCYQDQHGKIQPKPIANIQLENLVNLLTIAYENQQKKLLE